MSEFGQIKGTNDYFAGDADARREMEQTFRENFRNFGAQEVIPPAIESADLLNSKSSEELREEGLFYNFTPKSFNVLNEAAEDERDVADLDPQEFIESGLRFDGTVGVSRIMAENKDVSKPAKWFYNIPVWRYEDTGEDRLREFWQSGIEYLGTEQLAHDAEAVALANQQLEDIGLEDAYFELNNRKFISGVLEEYGIPQSQEQGALTVLDKLDKKERSELLDEAENDKGIDREDFEDVLLFLNSDYGFSDLDILRQQFDGNSTAQEGIDELDTLRGYLESFDAAESVEFSPTLARGLDYYTGIVFEGLHEDADSSIAGGGRYDDLISDIGGEATPGVGFALGNDRIINVLQEQGNWDEDVSSAGVYMIPVTDGQEDIEYAIEAATDIRRNGMETDIDFSGRSIGQAFSYVDNQDIPYAAVVGSDEREAGTVTIRDMDSGDEYELPSSKVGQKLGEVRDRVE